MDKKQNYMVAAKLTKIKVSWKNNTLYKHRFVSVILAY